MKKLDMYRNKAILWLAATCWRVPLTYYLPSRGRGWVCYSFRNSVSVRKGTKKNVKQGYCACVFAYMSVCVCLSFCLSAVFRLFWAPVYTMYPSIIYLPGNKQIGLHLVDVLQAVARVCLRCWSSTASHLSK